MNRIDVSGRSHPVTGLAMIRTSLVLAFTLILVVESFAASPDPKDLAIPEPQLTKARNLVHQLADEDYKVREEANKALAKMGRLARPVLLEAVATDPSAEVRSRAARLLPKADALELQARINTFLADQSLAYDHDLPGWEEFCSIAGAQWQLFSLTCYKDLKAGKAARTAYVELLDAAANRNLLMGIGGDSSSLGHAVAARKWELYQNRMPRGRNRQVRNPTVPDVIALLFAETQITSRFAPVGRVISMSFLLNSAGINGAFNGKDDKTAVYRAVIARWIESRDDSSSQYQAMSVATSLNMPDSGARIAVRLLNDRKGTPSYRGHAAVNLVRWKSREALPALEQAMTDDTILYSVPRPGNRLERDTILVQDVAFVAAIFLTDQNPTDYGFYSRYNNGSTKTMTSYMQWMLPSGSWCSTFIRRALMQAKWSEWQKEQDAKAKAKP